MQTEQLVSQMKKDGLINKSISSANTEEIALVSTPVTLKCEKVHCDT